MEILTFDYSKYVSKDCVKYPFCSCSTHLKNSLSKLFLELFSKITMYKNTGKLLENCKNISPIEINCSNIVEEMNTNFTTAKSVSGAISSTPTLIVSDTTTGVNNFLLDSKQLSTSHVLDMNSVSGEHYAHSDSHSLEDARRVSSSSTILQRNTDNDTGIETDSDPTLFLPLKVPVCDSAYSSSIESRSGSLSPSVYYNNERCVNPHSSENEPFLPADSSAELCDFLSVSPTFSPVFSSTSSIVSDCLRENESIDSPILETGNENKKLSSFLLRSSTAVVEESEDDNATCTDLSSQHDKSSKSSKIKAKKSWMKLRMAIWSPFMQSYKKKYPWVQLAGHAGSFQPGKEGCILKKYVEREADCLEGLNKNAELHDFVPIYHGIVERKNEKYTRMQDLLMQFDCPSIMDCKMGIRTYLEDELMKAKVNPCLRPDMYQKMIEISPEEPTVEEREQKAVTKPRYMRWREKVSSTSTLGFRIEGIKKSGKDPSKDFKLTKTLEDVSAAFKSFIDGNLVVLAKYLERLNFMRKCLESSVYFQSHEAIGSSLLFVHDSTGLANVWMIDFGKTTKLPDDVKLDHRSVWKEGNREDGYLFGMDNMIDILSKIHDQLGEERSESSVNIFDDDATFTADLKFSLGHAYDE